ncbi:hypothetical protein QBC39DRAFT_360699, partial [Podospora conica]
MMSINLRSTFLVIHGASPSIIRQRNAGKTGQIKASPLFDSRQNFVVTSRPRPSPSSTPVTRNTQGTNSSSHPEPSPSVQRKSLMVRITWRQCNTRDTVADDHGQAQREVHRGAKISIINNLVRRPVSEIKLIRTDTTLDLSQKG